VLRFLGIGFEILAESQNVVVNRPCAWKDIVPPDGLENFFSTDDLSFAFGKESQQVRFSLGHESFFPIPSLNFKTAEVHLASLSKNQLIRDFSSRTFAGDAHEFFQSQQQFLEVERLAQIIIGAQLKAMYAVFTFIFRGQEKNGGQIPLVSNRLAHPITIQFRHHDVQHSHIDSGISEMVQGPATVLGLGHLPILILEVHPKHFAQGFVIFCEQDARFVTFLEICFAHVGIFARMSVDRMKLGKRSTIADALGIELLKIEDDVVTGRMPVDHRTQQPYGLLHGGASVVLAETLGSVGSHFLVAHSGRGAVGVEINANHIKGVSSGWVEGEARLVHRGGRLHVWSIDVRDEEGSLVCTSRLTVMIVQNHA